ncbi:putative inactive receptor kinase [Hordeum vulgare]|uniref:Protein kinase domain-containing protein n=1 Tax=Hordeum vulgare subsp. vulgare TaxID=112509 RepID=A0A8I6X3P9_HORVV|nr:probable inactive receptor kinase At1g48480 [Hordeum vulgare subsp. vulgare]KAE8792030.1 putative inactive receptor kinase [Hordeum vulgare]
MAAMPRPARLALAVLALASVLPAYLSDDLNTDAQALEALRKAVGRSALPSWNSSTQTCQWQGVACENGRVVELRLPGAGLIGALPSGVLGNLTALRTLSLRWNALTGPIPDDVSRMTELRAIYFQHNAFSGEVPASLYTLRNLVRVNIGHNKFSGEISPDFNKLNRLGSLILDANDFSGEIPKLDLPTLEQFNVSYNKLNGSIPHKLRKMPKDSFLGTGLCGGPLGLCPGETAETPAGSPGAQPGGGGAAADVGRGKKKLSGGAIAGIAIACVFGLLLLLALLFFLCRKKSGSAQRSTAAVEKGRDLGMGPLDAAEPKGQNGNGVHGGAAAAAAAGAVPAAVAAAAKSGGSTAGSKKLIYFGPMAAAPPFDLEDLLRASAEVLGKGAFGTAYKAVMESGAAVAVKRLKDVDLPEPEFRERIAAIGAVQHELVVPLRAYYFSKDEKLLVYDYMSMGSLSALLHGNRSSGLTPLDWEARSAIALATARGVAHIHSTGPTASHGNIKSSNVLLTKSYEARVSDHGLPTLVGPSFSPTRVSGYRAPEVTDIRRVSQKADVYSFGVLLLELLTGKAPTHAVVNEEGLDLPRWVQSVVREEWTAEVFDQELLRYHNVEEEMVQLLQLAIDCSAQHPDRRPNMSDAAARIDEIRRSASSAQHATTDAAAAPAPDGDEPSL